MSNTAETDERSQNVRDVINKTPPRVRNCARGAAFVVLTTKDGFEITESSACVDKASYDEKIGAEICLERIKNKLWTFEGYCLQKQFAQ